MNHCIDCGESVTKGRTDGKGNHVRCMACENAHTFKTWRYTLSPAQRQRRKLEQRIAELEAQHGQ